MPERVAAQRIVAKTTETLGGTRTLTALEVQAYNAFAFDCNGAGRNLDLPAEAACTGLLIPIHNTTAATHALTVRNAAAGTVVAIPATKSALVWCDGLTWHALLGA